MSTQNKMITLIFTILLATPFVPTLLIAATNASSGQTLQGVANLQIPFVQNKGQVADPAVAYTADTFACQVRVTKDGQIVYRLPEKNATGHQATEIREQMTGATVTVHGIDRQPTIVNHYSGRDTSKWQTRLPSYSRVGVGHTTNGIRLELKAHSQNVEKLFYVQPGADPSAIRMTVQGAKKLKINTQGELELITPSGAVRFTKPVAYQEIKGTRRNVPVHYQVNKYNYGFILEDYDTSKELVIDPLVKVWYIYSVSEKFENIDAAIMRLTTDDHGNVYAAGYATHQLIIYKLDKRLENILASTFIDCKGTYSYSIRSMVLDRRNNLFVAGTTNCTGFPITPNAPDSRLSEGDSYSSSSINREGFIAKYSENLELLASTFIGGDNQDEVFAMAVNSKDQVYVAGYSQYCSIDKVHFDIIPGGYDSKPGPEFQKKGFVARFNYDLSEIEATTFLGGSIDDVNNRNEDVVHCMIIDKQDNVWVAGHTTQPDFPATTGSLDTTYNGEGDLFLAELDSDLKNLHFATYIGGSKDEAPTDMLFDHQSNLYLLGWTFSDDFPMVDGGFDTTYGLVEEDGFILKINAEANKIIASTYLGGENEQKRGDDVPTAMALVEDGSQLLVVGRSESINFPTTPDCFRSQVDAGSPENIRFPCVYNRDPKGDNDFGDGFLTVLNGDLSGAPNGRPIYSTFIGSARCEYFDDIILNGEDVLVAGKTESYAFPLAWVEESDVDANDARGLILRFNPKETPDEPYNPNTTLDSDSDSDSGGGGGGCFIATCW